MRISEMRQIYGVIAALVVACVSSQAAVSAEVGARSIPDELGLADQAFRTGRIEIGVAALQRAAEQGSLRAMINIGNLYNDGLLVPRDRLRACQTYVQAADRFEQMDRFHPAARLIAEAFRLGAQCHATGLPEAGWPRNMNAAANMYFHAGVILGDPIGLYELAKLYLNGEGITRNPTIAIKHLEESARKGHPPAQALLGSMMWDGKVMKKRPAAGLALLILGKERTSPEDRAWIYALYDDAIITASKDLEQEAITLAEQWKSVHGDPSSDALQTAATAPGQQEVPPPSRSPLRQLNGIDINQAKGTDSFGSLPTRANVPPSASSPQGGR
jgi:exopolysaccharide production negative regulator